MRDKPLNLLHTYLIERKQHIKIGGECSSTLIVTTGVTQYTVLGPLLFGIYMNDLLNLILQNMIISYVNET